MTVIVCMIGLYIVGSDVGNWRWTSVTSVVWAYILVSKREKEEREEIEECGG